MVDWEGLGGRGRCQNFNGESGELSEKIFVQIVWKIPSLPFM